MRLISHVLISQYYSLRKVMFIVFWSRILEQVTIYRRLQIGRDGHIDQSEAYDIS